MEAASTAIQTVLITLTATQKVGDALQLFVKQLEKDYLESEDITLFVFALRAFFCWQRAPELLSDSRAVAEVRGAWLKQNDGIYTQWLSSAEDNPKELRWAKWTFQAKNSIFDEYLKLNN